MCESLRSQSEILSVLAELRKHKTAASRPQIFFILSMLTKQRETFLKDNFIGLSKDTNRDNAISSRLAPAT